MAWFNHQESGSKVDDSYVSVSTLAFAVCHGYSVQMAIFFTGKSYYFHGSFSIAYCWSLPEGIISHFDGDLRVTVYTA